MVICYRRLALAGYTGRHDEPSAGRLLSWSPEKQKRVGRPVITSKMILQDDTGLDGENLQKATRDQMSTFHPSDDSSTSK